MKTKIHVRISADISKALVTDPYQTRTWRAALECPRAWSRVIGIGDTQAADHSAKVIAVLSRHMDRSYSGQDSVDGSK